MTIETIKLLLEVANTIFVMVSALAIVITSIIAIYGINAWRKEFQGKRNIELAEEVLCLFYQAERAVGAIRFPIYHIKKQGREPEEGETPAQKQARDQANVVFEKIKERSQIFDELYKLRFRFMARFGKDKTKPFDEIKAIIDEIWVCTQRLAELWALELEGIKPSKATEKSTKEYMSIIWSHSPDDPIKPRVEKVISDIEAICKPIILGKN